MNGALSDVLKQRNIPFYRDVLTATLCSFHIGGPAALVIEPQCGNELVDAVRLCREYGVPFSVIGKGTNILFDDGEIHTALIRTTALNAVRFDENEVRADCGVSLVRLAFLAAARDRADLAFAAGIPGTVGGAVFMNAGANGACVGDLVKSVRVYDPQSDKIKTLFVDELNYSYRKSIFQENHDVILSATLRVANRAPREEVLSNMRAFNLHRSRTQPCHLPSAGSVFRRPRPDVAISRIIDELGLKGLRVGGAVVSHVHAGFIVNDGNATAADVKALMEALQNIMEKERGIRPIPEVRFIPEQV